MCARQLGADWQQRYGYEPVLLETFVEHKRFAGTSYPANWQYLGLTKGLVVPSGELGRGKGWVSSKAVFTSK